MRRIIHVLVAAFCGGTIGAALGLALAYGLQEPAYIETLPPVIITPQPEIEPGSVQDWDDCAPFAPFERRCDRRGA